jgi:hypothetical protein
MILLATHKCPRQFMGPKLHDMQPIPPAGRRARLPLEVVVGAILLGILMLLPTGSMGSGLNGSNSAVVKSAPYVGSHSLSVVGAVLPNATYPQDSGCYHAATTQTPFFNSSTGALGYAGSASARNCRQPINSTAYFGSIGLRLPFIEIAIPVPVSSSSIHLVAHITLDSTLNWNFVQGKCKMNKSTISACTQLSMVWLNVGQTLYDTTSGSAGLAFPGDNQFMRQVGFGNDTYCDRHRCSPPSNPVANSTSPKGSVAATDSLSLYLNATGLTVGGSFWLHVYVWVGAWVMLIAQASTIQGGSGSVSFVVSGSVVSITAR